MEPVTPVYELPSDQPIWRDTMAEGYIAVRHFSQDVRELPSKDLKDWRHDFDKVVTLNINTQIDFPQ